MTKPRASGVAFETVWFPIGMGSSAFTTFASELNSGMPVSDLVDWHNEIHGQLFLYRLNPGWVGAPPYGDWYTSTGPHFLGLRMNELYHGWLEIDLGDVEHPLYIRSVIQLP